MAELEVDKIKSNFIIFSSINTFKRVKRQATDWEMINTMYILGKGNISRTHTEFTHINKKDK